MAWSKAICIETDALSVQNSRQIVDMFDARNNRTSNNSHGRYKFITRVQSARTFNTYITRYIKSDPSCVPGSDGGRIEFRDRRNALTDPDTARSTKSYFPRYNPAVAFIVFDHRCNYTKRIRLLIIQREIGQRGLSPVGSLGFFPLRNVGEIDFGKIGRLNWLIVSLASIPSKCSMQI